MGYDQLRLAPGARNDLFGGTASETDRRQVPPRFSKRNTYGYVAKDRVEFSTDDEQAPDTRAGARRLRLECGTCTVTAWAGLAWARTRYESSNV